MRPGMVLLGVGLGLLWLLGLAAHAPAWEAWIELALACASILSVLAPDAAIRHLRVAPFVVGMALLAVWIAVLATQATPGLLPWAALAFGCAYLLLGVAVVAAMAPPARLTRRRIF